MSKLHVPIVASGYDDQGGPAWRVFCDACSQTADDYVPVCTLPDRSEWPAVVLVPVEERELLAAEVERLKAELADCRDRPWQTESRAGDGA